MYDNYDYRLATIKTKHVKGNIQLLLNEGFLG